MKSCKEKKRFLSGDEVTYNCKLITLSKKFGILKYIVDKKQQVGSLTLQSGTISYGFFWQDRPYILYKWFDKNGDVLGDYFSLADSVKLSENEFFWRDLIIDILVLPTGKVEVLDEDEIPKSLDKKLRTYIESAKQMLLNNWQTIITETNAILNQYLQ